MTEKIVHIPIGSLSFKRRDLIGDIDQISVPYVEQLDTKNIKNTLTEELGLWCKRSGGI